jgi:hypothetical protein
MSSIATVEIRSFSGPDLVELDGVNRPAIIRLNVGPRGLAGAAGPNSVTSATTSDGTAELSLESVSIGSGTTTATLDVTQLQIINDINEVVATSSGVVVASYLESGTSQASLTADSIQIGATGGGSANIYATGSADFSGEVTAANLTVTPSGSLILTSTNSGGFVSINGEAATDARTVAFPDASGTVSLFDGSGNLTVSGILYADHIHGNLAGSVYAHVRAGETLAKGDPVYISGSHGTAPNLIPIVSKADASNAAKMPAIGIMDADLANNANGHMVITGTIADLNTAAYSVNDTLYVASGGGFTATPPAANSQPVARVERSNANNGALIVKVNGLASNGGNGASDANKLVRFSSTGGISQTGGTMTDTTYAGTASFTSTTRPTSAGTGTPAATSLMTRNDVDARGGYAISQTVAVNESGDQNTITFKTSTNLAMTLEAGTWDFECLIIVDCNNTTAGSKQRMNFSGTQTTFAGVLYTVFDGSTTSTRFPTAKSTSLVDSEFSVGAASTATLRIGRIVVTASGVLSAQFAQRTATAGTSPTLVAGSYLRARKIS